MQVDRGHGSGWERSSYDHQRFKGRLETPAHEFPSTYRRMHRARGPTSHRTMGRNLKEAWGWERWEKKDGKKWDLDGEILGLP